MKIAMPRIYFTVIASCMLLMSCAKDEGGAEETVPVVERNQYIEWDHTIGGISWEVGGYIQQTSDGGYILAGSSTSPIGADKTEGSYFLAWNLWVVKLDGAGEIVWQNSIGGNRRDDIFAGILETNDGGYIIGATSNSDGTGDKTEGPIGGSENEYDYWVVKLDANGNVEWENTIGGSGEERMRSIITTADGGYLLGGESNSSISGDKTEDSYGDPDYWLVKLDASGNIQWQKTYGGLGYNSLRGMMELDSGAGYIVTGGSDALITGSKTEPNYGSLDMWVLRLDINGNELWQKSFGTELHDIGRAILPISATTFLLLGNSQSGEGDIMVCKMNIDGEVLMEKIMHGIVPGEDTSILRAIRTTDGNFVLGGDLILQIPAGPQLFDYFIMKIDENGNVLNQTVFLTPGFDQFGDIDQTLDGGYIVAGESSSFSSIDKTEDPIGNPSEPFDFWVIKVSSDF